MYDIERFQELLISENSRTVCINANFSLKKGKRQKNYKYICIYLYM